MGMFTAYFDASGKSTRQGLLSIAGFVSDAKKWARFDAEWTKVLRRESVSCFHMTDFVSSQREFSGWNNQPGRRKAFIADLLACAKKYTNKAFGGAVVLADYASVNERYAIQEAAGYPYPLCAHYCVRLVLQWQKKHGISNVRFAFEAGDEHPGDLTRLCKSDGVEPFFLTKKEIPFQAADLVAWRTRDCFEKALRPSLTIELAGRLHRSFSEVWKSPHQAFYGDKRRLERFCREEGIPGRVRTRIGVN